MIKNIKRVGIIFLAVAIICLMAIGCLSVNSVANNGSNVGVLSSEKSNSASGDMNSESNIFNYNADSKEEVPSAESEYFLTCDCPNGSPCTCGQMAKIWNNACKESMTMGNTIKVTLLKDWIAGYPHDAFVNCFVEVADEQQTVWGEPNYGFSNGRIAVRDGVQMVIDLNGKTIDRRMPRSQGGAEGSVIILFTDKQLDIIDSSYTEDIKNQVQTIYDTHKANKDNLVSALKDLPVGKITGGWGNGAGGCINMMNTSTLKLHGGILMNNQNATGGAINIYQNTTLHMYNGIIVDNKGNTRAGGISVSGGTFNMYDGIIAGNSTPNIGGGVCVRPGGTANIYNGIITNNEALAGGGIYGEGTLYAGDTIVSASYINFYNGIISYNHATYFGGGVTLSTSTFVMHNGDIVYNTGSSDSGAMLLDNKSTFEMNGGRISYNTIKNDKVSNNNSGNILVLKRSKFILNSGEISNNVANYTALQDKQSIGGFFIGDLCSLYLNGGIIQNNRAIANENQVYTIGGIGCANKGVIYIGGTPHVRDNCVELNGVTRESDLHLSDGQRLNITNLLLSYNDIARIGIESENDETKPFTINYTKSANVETNIFLFFFSNKDNQLVDLKSDGELYMINGTPANVDLTWNWNGDESGNTKENFAFVTYTGNPFVLSLNDNKKFNKVGTSTMAETYSLTEAGSYSFVSVDSRYTNPTFTFTILPKEVDVLWNNTSMVYNGGTQKPTAYIAEDANCKVTVIGEQINSGNGYVATATKLSNTNYKINTKTMNKTFSIAKAKLQKPNGSGSYEYNGEEHTFEPNGYNFVTMDISGNKQTEVGSYNAVVAIKDKVNCMWADGTNADITIPYAITLAPPVNEENGVYRFIYYDEADGTRKTYKEGGLVHGINDSEVNGGKAILGNISPNTSVKVFIENLGFDTNNIQLFAGNKLVYDKTNGYILNDNNYDNGAELAVGTGWYINYTAVNGEVETIYLSVLGDITGDGKVNSADVNYLRQIVNNNSFESLSAEQKLATLIVNKGKEPTSTDVQILWEAVCGRIDINEFI